MRHRSAVCVGVIVSLSIGAIVHADETRNRAERTGSAISRQNDPWGNESRYLRSSERKSYRLVSAGNVGIFDEAARTRSGVLVTSNEHAVMAEGGFVRVWDDDTGPGVSAEARARKSLKPAARALLERADARLAANDHSGAIRAYIEAVKADPAAASLEDIHKYEPLPPFSSAGNEPQIAKDEKLRGDALRQYLQIHPGDWPATQDLLTVVTPAEAETLLRPFLAARPRDPELYRTRATLRAKAGRWSDSLDDYVAARDLKPEDP